jgi:hypothetical protein
MFSEPLAGWRHVGVTEHRTKKDYAYQLKFLVDIYHPEAEKITLIHDNLNTHVSYALYETFEPQEAKRILDKLDIHYTPKHGSRADSFSGLIPFLSLFNRLWGKQSKVFLKIFRYLF